MTWDNVESHLVQAIGPGNVALAGTAYDMIAQFVAQGPSGLYNLLRDKAVQFSPQDLFDTALKAGTDYIVHNVVPRAVSYVAAKFAVPGLGALAPIYYPGMKDDH